MKPEQAMQIYLAECSVHAAVLDEALVDVKKWMPLSDGTHLDKELLRILDQIAYRFTKLQDSMGEKALILELAQETISSSATFAEKLNKLERIGAQPMNGKNFVSPAMQLRTHIPMIRNYAPVQSTVF